MASTLLRRLNFPLGDQAADARKAGCGSVLLERGRGEGREGEGGGEREKEREKEGKMMGNLEAESDQQ